MMVKIIGVTDFFSISTALTQLLESRLENPGPQHQEQAINNEHIISILKNL